MANITGFVGSLATHVRDLRTTSFICSREALRLRTNIALRSLDGKCYQQVTKPAQPQKRRLEATAVPIEVTEENFHDEVIASDVPVVVDFYTTWCGPCNLMTPVVEWAAAEFEGRVKLVKIDTEKYTNFVKKYKIYGLPTFVVFVNGEAKGTQEGAMSKSSFQKYIEDNALSPA